MIIVVPAVIPLTIPVAEIGPAPGLLLLQLPPGDGSLNEAIRPTHTDDAPAIGAGSGFTVTIVIIVQPEPIM